MAFTLYKRSIREKCDIFSGKIFIGGSDFFPRDDGAGPAAGAAVPAGREGNPGDKLSLLVRHHFDHTVAAGFGAAAFEVTTAFVAAVFGAGASFGAATGFGAGCTFFSTTSGAFARDPFPDSDGTGAAAFFAFMLSEVPMHSKRFASPGYTRCSSSRRLAVSIRTTFIPVSSLAINWFSS